MLGFLVEEGSRRFVYDIFRTNTKTICADIRGTTNYYQSLNYVEKLIIDLYSLDEADLLSEETRRSFLALKRQGIDDCDFSKTVR